MSLSLRKFFNGGAANNYSETEQVIGTWIDGTPLYQKTFAKTMVVDGGNIAPLNITGEYKLRFFHACLSYDDHSSQESTFFYAGDNVWTIWAESGYIKGKANQSVYGGKPVYITVQ